MTTPTESTPDRHAPLRPRTVPQDEKPVSIIPPQDLAYYEGQSPDFCLDLIPATAQRVLDVGCGRGWLGRRLKERGVAEVVGVESFAVAAEEARQHLDVVHAVDIESVALEYPAGYFDCIVYSGVLEHLRDPWYVLYEHRRILADTGSFVALLPNVQHFSVILDLLQGRWPYQSAGQLDATHYRFFTREEIRRMCTATGFQLRKMTGYRVFDTPPVVRELTDALRQTSLVTDDFIQDLEVYIWVLRADKVAAWTPPARTIEPVHIAGVGTLPTAIAQPPAVLPPLPTPQPAPPVSTPAAPAPAPAAAAQAPQGPETSIVIVSHNTKADLQACLSSLVTHSRTRWEVIVVDNASTDGSAEWLRDQRGLLAILNDENLGYSVAANQGLRLARGEYCILLNPDTIVTEGWDTRLVAHAGQPDIGAVGPVANGESCCGWQQVDRWIKGRLSGEQQISTVARYVADAFAGKTHPTKLLTGFCLCVPKRVFDRVGLLDEDLFIGNDDVELSLRLQWAGLRLVVALDAFVLHKGRRSFTNLPDSTRARYIQESTDVLYAKLEDRFGKGNVPPWPELIELPWHAPSHLRDDAFTGERANPYSPNMLPDIMTEHWARYDLARSHARGKRVLDAACGTGYGSAHLAEVAAVVTGWDVDPGTVAYARGKSPAANLHFGVGDVRTLPLADDSFDVITSFETIEHVKEGRQVLAEFRRLLKPDGVLLISTPLGSEDGNPYHFAHYNRADFVPLLEEFFGSVEMRYQQGASIYDQPKTPLVAPRFMDEYAVAICREPKHAGNGSGAAMTPLVECTAAVPSGNGRVEPVSAEATPSSTLAGDTPVVSIIIPAWNQLDYTCMCIESIRAHTPEAHEIIVVDNGSTDGTGEWLATQADIHSITNESNRGFAVACNQGLAAARGAYLVLLNNDTVVTPGWTTQLIGAIERNANTGLVGPRSNKVGGAQIDPDARYTDIPGMLAYAAARTAERAAEAEDVPWLSGFCWMVPRDVYETVGALDERFGAGTFEDNDYCKRVAMAGRRLLIAHDTFIHHHCSVTFAAAGIDYQEQMAANKAIFEEKWAADPTCRGMEAYGAAQWDRAGELFREATEATPEYADPYRNLAALHLRFFRYGEAAAMLERLCELQPLHHAAQVELAKTYRRLGRAAEAAALVQPLLNHAHLSAHLRAEALVVAGDLAVCAEDWDAAARAFRAAVTARETSAGGWNGLGLVAHHAGNTVEARASFRRASDLDAGAADPLSNLGVLEWREGKMAEALSRFGAALDRNPVHADALDNFVAAALAEGQPEAARRRLEAALEREPGWSEAQELLAQCAGA